jgi:hypothetical protein
MSKCFKDQGFLKLLNCKYALEGVETFGNGADEVKAAPAVPKVSISLRQRPAGC